MPKGRRRDYLTPRQLMAARLIAEGKSVQETADLVKTVGTRIQHWLNNPLFSAEITNARENLKTIHEKVVEKIETTLLPAVKTLETNLDHASGVVQNDAAKSLLASGGHGPIAKTVQITATVNVTDDLLERLERVLREAADVAARAGRLLPEAPQSR